MTNMFFVIFVVRNNSPYYIREVIGDRVSLCTNPSSARRFEYNEVTANSIINGLAERGVKASLVPMYDKSRG